MEKIFNIAGPCKPEIHYLLPATEQMLRIMRLIEEHAYFIIHTPLPYGKTTLAHELVNTTNANGKHVAMYCSLYGMQDYPDCKSGLQKLYEIICNAALAHPVLQTCPSLNPKQKFNFSVLTTSAISGLLRELAIYAKKPLIIFFDDIECLTGSTMRAFQPQIRSAFNSQNRGRDFPSSIAFIGKRSILNMHPAPEYHCNYVPFNIITKCIKLSPFTIDEIRQLYQQHTEATGQIFEPGVPEFVFDCSKGQPNLVNALARCCIDDIHVQHFDKPITLANMYIARERIMTEQNILV